MAAIVVGRKENYPKRERKNGRWYFRANYDQIKDSDEFAIVETCLLTNNATLAANQINEFNHARGDERTIDASYFDTPAV